MFRFENFRVISNIVKSSNRNRLISRQSICILFALIAQPGRRTEPVRVARTSSLVGVGAHVCRAGALGGVRALTLHAPRSRRTDANTEGEKRCGGTCSNRCRWTEAITGRRTRRRRERESKRKAGTTARVNAV